MKAIGLLSSMLLVMVAGFWLTGCATQAPELIRETPEEVALPNEVRQDPDRFEGATVRWGGIITGVENLADYTLVHVLSRPLRHNGRPRDTDAGYGRFLARFPGFVEPEVFAPGRELTVRGAVRGVELIPVGNYDYPYVLVDVDVHYLWPGVEPVRDPYYYAPAWRYDPWYPYRYPYFGPWH